MNYNFTIEHWTPKISYALGLLSPTIQDIPDEYYRHYFRGIYETYGRITGDVLILEGLPSETLNTLGKQINALLEINVNWIDNEGQTEKIHVVGFQQVMNIFEWMYSNETTLQGGFYFGKGDDMAKKSYWQDRFEQLEASQMNKGHSYYLELEKQYQQAYREIEKQVSTWYQRFAVNNQISMLEAKRMLNTRELAEFRWDVMDYIKNGEQNALDASWMKQLENASARVHVSRLQALKIQMQQQIEVLFGNQVDDFDNVMKRIYTDGYYHTAYEIQKGFNIGWDIASLNKDQLEKIISKPWAVDGKNFSERIWANKQKLINELHTQMTQNILLGRSPDAAIKNISKKFNTSKNNAGRLVMTESAYFASASQRDCFNELDVERFEIVATLDSHTSEICQELDGQVFDMKDFEAGVTAPPFHVWCRSCTCPYFEDNYGERVARRNGETYYVPGNMKYNEWYNEYVEKPEVQNVKAKLKQFGIKGELSYPVKPLNTDELTFNDKHINKERKHNISENEAKQYINEAVISITRWKGQFVNYYGYNGAAYVDVNKKAIRTAFKNTEYDEKLLELMEVLRKSGFK